MQKKGLFRKYLTAAASCLSAEELRVMVATELRSRAVRVSLPDYAGREGIALDDLIALRNVAAAKLKAHINPTKVSENMSCFQDWQNPLERRRHKSKEAAAKTDPFAAYPPDIRDILHAEHGNVPAKGSFRKCLLDGAACLSAGELKIMAATEFRSRAVRLPLPDYAAQQGIPLDAAIALRNGAAAKLKENLRPTGTYAKLSFFQDWRDPLEKREKKIRVKADPFAVYPPDIQAVLRAESGNVSAQGSFRKYLLDGAGCLCANELKVLSATALRFLGARISLPDYAAQEGLSLDAAIALYNGAAAKLKEKTGPTGNHEKLPCFHDWVSPHEKRDRRLKDAILKADPFAAHSPEIQDILRAENDIVQKKGFFRKYFYEGAKGLSPAEFKILIVTEFRCLEARVSLQDYAAQAGLSLDAAIVLRNGAAAKLKENIGPTGKNEKLSCFNDWKAQREKPQRKHKEVVAKPSAGKTEARVVAAKSPEAEAKPRAIAPVPAKPLSKKATKAFIEEEGAHVSEAGPSRYLFSKAVQCLHLDELKLMARTELRPSGTRLDLRQYAHEEGIDIVAAIEMRNRAARKMKNHVMPSAAIENMPCFHDWVGPRPQPPVKEEPPQAPSPSEPDETYVKERQAILKEEGKKIAEKGIVRMIFTRAAEVLDNAELKIYSTTLLRGDYTRISLRAYADIFEIDFEKAVALRDRACAKMKDSVNPDGKYSQRSFFEPFQPGQK